MQKFWCNKKLVYKNCRVQKFVYKIGLQKIAYKNLCTKIGEKYLSRIFFSPIFEKDIRIFEEFLLFPKNIIFLDFGRRWEIWMG